MPYTTDDDEGEGSPRSSASETIAALWQEREDQLAAMRPPPPPPPTARAPRSLRGSRPQAPAVPAPPVPPPPPAYLPPSPMSPPSPPASPRQGLGIGTLAAVVVGALVLAGGAGYLLAGRDGGPSRAAFIAKADAVCRPADALLSVTRPSSYPELATAAGTFATAAEGELGQLRQISRPGGSAGAEALTVVNDLALTSEAARSLRQAAEQKDDAATVTATKQLSTASAGAAGAAGVYGMTACGSGLQPTVQTLTLGTQSVIKAGFKAKADTLCRAAADQTIDLGDPDLGNPDDLLAYLEAAIVIQAHLGDELRALPVPPGDEAAVAEMLAASDKVTAKARSLTNSVANGDESGFIVASREITTLGTTADAKLDAYGLGVCGSNFGNI